MTAKKTATYKGRTYRLLFIGTTKFGQKAKLGFMDGSKEFWVDSNLVTVGGTPTAQRPYRDCDDFCQGCRLCR
jgi:hypothetical protein